ncbi:hypothetical protein B0H14DRAFT_2572500 [Mycena olivaceomarginata]|nr:hypothetical protein B0H14DRAFT_2572500 [Mycena olivaceomarginata]
MAFWPEAKARTSLPASFETLHSFALWAPTDPAIVAPVILANTPFEPVSVDTVNQYLTAARAWRRILVPTWMARLDLPSAKTALAGEIQHIFVVPQPGLCPWSHYAISPASSQLVQRILSFPGEIADLTTFISPGKERIRWTNWDDASSAPAHQLNSRCMGLGHNFPPFIRIGRASFYGAGHLAAATKI